MAHYLSTDKKYKFIGGYFLLVIICIVYIYSINKDIHQNIKGEKVKDIIMHYSFYKKIYKTHPKLKNILLENIDYIDKEDLIDEFSQITPLMMEKKDKKIPKYNLTVSFFDKSKRHNLDIENKIASLKSDDYIYKLREDSIYLFGKVFEDGYVLIVKQLQQSSEIKEDLDNVFIKVFIIAILNLFIFLYILNLIKDQELSKEQMYKEFEQLQIDTQKVAFEDTLTGAATRLKFDETLKDLVNISSRFEEQKFTALMIDIDNFKKVNDTYGHDYGDIVLKSIASVIKEQIRSTDIFARWGGEEFVILSPMNNLQNSILFAEKIRKLINNIKFEKINSVSCSFGLVEFQKGDTEKSLIKRADELLYKAKANGKNRVEY